MAVSLSNEQKVLFYSSSDLKTWAMTGQFESIKKVSGDVWECPDLVYIQSEENPAVSKWLLVVNVNPGGF